MRLKLLPEYFNWLRVGNKITTIHYKKGKIRYPAYYVLDVTCEKERFVVKVIKAVVKEYNYLTEEDAINDGFNTLDELRDALESIYGEIKPYEPVTIYYLERYL